MIVFQAKVVDGSLGGGVFLSVQVSRLLAAASQQFGRKHNLITKLPTIASASLLCI